MAEAISADLPELRLLAQLAGVAPTKLAAAYRTGDLDRELTAEEFSRYMAALRRVGAFLAQTTDTINSATATIVAGHKGRP